MRGSRFPAAAMVCAGALALSACEYVRLLRPAVIRQVNPRTAALIDYLPEVDKPNQGIIGRLFAHGGLSHARVGPDGIMRDRVRVRLRGGVWEPAIIVLPRPGTLELEVANEDENAQRTTKSLCQLRVTCGYKV